MSPTANEIALIANANHYTMGNALAERLLKLINKSEEKDKIRLALNYAFSVTKCEMRGTK